MKFALYDYLGQAKAFYIVDEEKLPSDAAKPARQVAHLAFVADASGSMWGDMDSLKSMFERLLTLEEYRDSDLLVSFLSYSGQGDLVVHFERIKVSEVMKPGSRYVEAIRTLGTRGLTCISQGLREVQKLVRPGETTCVTLLSDGFANDRSPGAEKREIDGIVEQFRKLPNVFVNTIALRTWADFKLLSYIANACSGTCFQTPTVKEVYDVLHQTNTVLTGTVTPAIDVPMGDHGYAVFASVAARKVIGGSQDLLVRGLRPSDDKVIYRYRRVESGKYASAPGPVCGEGGPIAPVVAFARAQLAEGNINTAKYALVAMRDQTLLAKHARALVNTEIAAMAEDIDAILFGGTPPTHTISDKYGLPNASAPSVLHVLGILSGHVSDIEVDIAALRNGYKRRGVRRLAGTRKEDGTVEKPWIKTAYRDATDFVPVSGFDFNRNNATVNMLISRPINIVKAEDGSIIPTVAGVKLDLRTFNNYTLVGDGLLNVERLRVRIKNKRLYRELVTAGILADEAFVPTNAYDVVLAGRPLIAYDATFDPSMFDGLFEKLARLKALGSIISASTKGQSDTYTDDQIAELKKHYLSTSMYLSLPTTNEYADLQKALSDGIIDTRISYKVDFGTSKILNLGELYSANEYLARRFTLTRGGAEEKKPKFDMRWDAGVTYGCKALTAKTKLNPVDDLMFPIMEDFLGLNPSGAIAGILAEIGWDAGQVTAFYAAAHGKASKDAAVETFADAGKAVDRAIEALFRDRVAPMVFFVGATGLVPDEFNARAMTAEQVKEKHPDLSIGKGEADGSFYLVGDTVICVYAKPEYFSTGKVPDVAAEDEAA